MVRILKYNLFKIGLLTLLVIVSISSCKKKDNSVDFHFDYFPLNQGRFIIYDVKEISHSSGLSGSDTSVYQLKTLIGEVYEDNQGRMARKFYRFKRNTSSQAWNFKDVWTTIISDYRAELVEENQRIVKLVFSPTESKVWDANSNNTLGELTCSYVNIHESLILGANYFDSTLIVEQEKEFNLIQYKRKYEVYAKGTGLIKKYSKDLKINNFDTLNITEGKELFMHYVSSGFE